jgi:hypothetical protein
MLVVTYSKKKGINIDNGVDAATDNKEEEGKKTETKTFKVGDVVHLTGQTAAKAGQLDGQIGVGRKITGVYVVEVPKGTTGLELEVDGSLRSSGQVIVKLN